MFHVVTTVVTADSFNPDVGAQFRMSLPHVYLNMVPEVGLVLPGIAQGTEVSD